jgi:hypothetical protein
MRTTPKKAHEGQARAKFNFVAQTNLELSLAKGNGATFQIQESFTQEENQLHFCILVRRRAGGPDEKS